MMPARIQVTPEELLLLCVFVAPCLVVGCPTIFTHPNDTTIALSSAYNYTSQLTLHCVTSSLNQSDQYIAWLKDKVQISDANYEIITNVYAVPIGDRYYLQMDSGNEDRVPLHINDITPCTAGFDSGNYSCMVMSKTTGCNESSDPAQITISVDGVPANNQCTVYTTASSTTTEITTTERVSSRSNIVKTENSLNYASSSVPTSGILGPTSSVQDVPSSSPQATNINPRHSAVRTTIHAYSTSTTLQTIDVNSRLSASTMPTQTTSPSDLTTIMAELSSYSKAPSHESVFEHPAFVAVSVSGAIALLVAITLLMIIIVYRYRGKENKERVGNEMEMPLSEEDSTGQSIGLSLYDSIDINDRASVIETDQNLMAKLHKGDDITHLHEETQRPEQKGSENSSEMIPAMADGRQVDDGKIESQDIVSRSNESLNFTSKKEEVSVMGNDGAPDNPWQNGHDTEDKAQFGKKGNVYETIGLKPVMSAFGDVANIPDGYSAVQNKEVAEKGYSGTENGSPSRETRSDNSASMETGERVADDEKTAPIKNEEGLTYADLDMSNVKPTYTGEEKHTEGESIVYAEIANMNYF